MKYSFAFVDETGISEDSKVTQPYFGVGFLKIENAEALNDDLITHHYNYYSKQRDNRRKFFKGLRDKPRIAKSEELSLLMLKSRHHEYKFSGISYNNLEYHQKFVSTSFKYPLAQPITVHKPFYYSVWPLKLSRF